MSSFLRSQSSSPSQNQKTSVSPEQTFMLPAALTSSEVIDCDNLLEEPATAEADRLLPILPTTDIDSCDRTTVAMAKVSITKLATIEPIYPDTIAS